jgi:hypothetical protein
MVEVAKRYQDSLERIKENVQEAYEYFKPNFVRWQEFQKFTFFTSLTDDDISVLKALGKPQIEFNILNAFVSRLRGEFSKQEPSIEVSNSYNAPVDVSTVNAVEGIIRKMECDSREDGTAYRIYTDQLAGGFSWFKVWTEYENPSSMQQVIKFGRVFDPTLCFVDPMAQKVHKSDARYWGEIFPKTEEEFKDEYPNVSIDDISFTREIGGFNWAYRNEKRKILLICDYYEKKKKKVKIVLLANNQSMTSDQYDEMIDHWEKLGVVQQPPAIIKTRMSTIDVICRYRLIENQVLEYVETDFTQPNYIFVDGDSVLLREAIQGALQQQTRPYVFHAKGIQRLKNVAGQTVANNIENQIQHKFKVPKEGIPVEYADAYKNIQSANTLVYNAFKDDDPNVPLPPPQEIAVVPSPPENINIFSASDQTTQSILGSYDASLGINNNQLSGIAIVEGATQSNAAAMPYVVNYMQALNQVAQVILDLIPKYYTLPRTLPVVNKEGKKDYIRVNQPGGVNLKYEDNALNVKVEAGINFAIQKSRALQQIIGLMQASQLFSQFMNQDGLDMLLDNLDIKGIDQLKERAEGFMQKMKMQEQMQQQMQQQQMQQAQQAQQNNPLMMRAQNERMKIAQSAQQMQVQSQLKAAEIAVDQQNAENDRLKTLAEMQDSKRSALVEMDKHQTEKTKAAVDMAIKAADMSHRHAADVHRIGHERLELHRRIYDQEFKHGNINKESEDVE